MNYNKDKIYKLRGVLEDWNKSSKDEKKDNLYWMNDEGFLRESEIVGCSWPTKSGHTSIIRYFLVGG